MKKSLLDLHKNLAFQNGISISVLIQQQSVQQSAGLIVYWVSARAGGVCISNLKNIRDQICFNLFQFLILVRFCFVFNFKLFAPHFLF